MAGLDSLDRTITKHCNEIIETATRIRDLEIRDPQTVRELGTNASRGFGEVTRAVQTVDSEGAWGELEALRKSRQQDGQGGC